MLRYFAQVHECFHMVNISDIHRMKSIWRGESFGSQTKTHIIVTLNMEYVL